MEPIRAAILCFDDVELLDFAGPYEVFTSAGRARGQRLFEVTTIGYPRRRVRARAGLVMEADRVLDDAPPAEILVVPGGRGTRALTADERLARWLAARAEESELVLSVCTGALLLASAGLLAGLPATTHARALDELRALSPTTEVRTGVRFVDTERVVSSAGVAAGIDAALHVVERRCGPELARETATYLEL